MGRADYLIDGDWNAICDSCGRKFKASQLKLRWDGFRVCKDDWEPRHPQDFVRGVKDIQKTSWIRSQTPDIFIFAGCTTITVQALANIGTADCATVYPEVNTQEVIYSQEAFTVSYLKAIIESVTIQENVNAATTVSNKSFSDSINVSETFSYTISSQVVGSVLNGSTINQTVLG